MRGEHLTLQDQKAGKKRANGMATKQHVHQERWNSKGRTQTVAEEPTAKSSCLGISIQDSFKLSLSL